MVPLVSIRYHQGLLALSLEQYFSSSFVTVLLFCCEINLCTWHIYMYNVHVAYLYFFTLPLFRPFLAFLQASTASDTNTLTIRKLLHGDRFHLLAKLITRTTFYHITENCDACIMHCTCST